jgi:serine O-acetyltransferase
MLWQTIEADLFRYEGKTGSLVFARLLRTPAFRYSVVLRLCNRLSFCKSSYGRTAFVLASLSLRHYSYKFGYQIPATAQIGSGLYLGHFGPVIVNHRAVLGCNVNLAPGVTIGQTNRGSREGCPRIGNSVWIGANSVVVGRITIGDNVLIAPGSYVNFDVPDNAVVAGNPAVVRSYAGVEGYVQNTVPIDGGNEPESVNSTAMEPEAGQHAAHLLR